MDFVRSDFDTNESADLEKKWRQKGSTGQRFICPEVTSYKIHTLACETQVQTNKSYDHMMDQIDFKSSQFLDKFQQNCP